MSREDLDELVAAILIGNWVGQRTLPHSEMANHHQSMVAALAGQRALRAKKSE